MSFAGMLGGMFNTFVAPFVFNAVYEYPIMISCGLTATPRPEIIIANTELLGHCKLYSLPCWSLPGLILHASVDDLLQYFDTIVISLIVLTCLTYLLRARPVGFALLTGAIIFLALGLHGLSSHTLYQERTFFGVLAVREAVLTDEQNQA